MKRTVKVIGLDPEVVGLHSMRRSGASYLHRIGVPLQDIKCAGDWGSLAVLSYLVTPMDRKVVIEQFTSTSLATMCNTSY